MSVKDLIWIQAAQVLKLKRNYELEKSKHEAYGKYTETLALLLADIRTLLHDSNFYERANAYKGAKSTRKIQPFKNEDLPSVAIELKKKEEEKIAKMTPEEALIYRFNKGEKIKG